MQSPDNAFKDDPDLYCHETLAYFDDSDDNIDHDENVLDVSSPSVSIDKVFDNASPISSPGFNVRKNNNGYNTQSHIFDTKEINKNHSRCKKRIDYESFDNCISILDDDDYVKLLHSDQILDIDKSAKTDNTTSSHNSLQSNYTSSLLNELNKSAKSSFIKRDELFQTGSSINANNKSLLKSHNVWPQTLCRYNDHEQQVPEITMTDQNEAEDENMDVLVIKDDAMCDSDSGSELDWNSLTPPVPASPSDQRVPESDSEFDLFSGGYYTHRPVESSSSAESFHSSQFPPVEHSNNNWYFHPQISFENDISQSEDDQVVPVL